MFGMCIVQLRPKQSKIPRRKVVVGKLCFLLALRGRPDPGGRIEEVLYTQLHAGRLPGPVLHAVHAIPSAGFSAGQWHFPVRC